MQIKTNIYDIGQINRKANLELNNTKHLNSYLAAKNINHYTEWEM